MLKPADNDEFARQMREIQRRRLRDNLRNALCLIGLAIVAYALLA